MSTDEELSHSDTDSNEIASQWRSKSLGGSQCFNCEVCGELLYSRADFQRHLLAGHDQNKPFSCDICHKQFKNWYPFQRHLHNSRCDRIMPKRIMRKRVMPKHIEPKCTPFLCKECGKQFRKNSHLAQHLLNVHCQDRPFCCDRCSATFKVEFNLTRHKIAVHREEKPFSCNQCNEKFKLKGDLRSHLHAIHSKVGSSTCNKFEVESCLQNHVVQVHCTNKSAAIQNVSNVEGDEILNEVKHTITHGPEFSEFQQDTTAASNEGNQLAQTSGSSFCQHLETSPPVICEEHTLFSCDLCGETFKLRMRLLRHLQRKHGADCEGHGADSSAESSNNERNDDSDDLGPPILDKENENFATTTSKIPGSFVTCPSCLKIFEEYQELQEHAYTCKKYLLFIKNERKHSRRALKTQEYGCSICDLTMFHAADLHAHLLEEHNIKFFYHLCAKSSCKK